MTNYTTLNISPLDDGELSLNKPLSIFINLNTYPMGVGTKEIKIKINDNEYIFTKEDIETLLKLAKKML